MLSLTWNGAIVAALHQGEVALLLGGNAPTALSLVVLIAGSVGVGTLLSRLREARRWDRRARPDLRTVRGGGPGATRSPNDPIRKTLSSK
jgi:hypothetical protein